MVKEADRNAAEDRRRKELIEARNTADNLVYQAEKALQELGDRIAVEERSRIERLVNELRQAMDSEDIDRMRQMSETLQQMVHSLSQQVYATQTEGQGGQGTPGNPPPTPDDTVEGEFREV